MHENPADQPLANAARPQITPTYDGSGQAVHPDIVYFPHGWRGWEYWLAVTPYPRIPTPTPHDDPSKENPSILVSHDGVAWQEPPGITNPIALPQTSYLADGDLFYDRAADELWVYYVNQKVNRQTCVICKTSADGVHWGAQTEEPGQRLFTVPDYELLSPAVAQVGATCWMWAVNTGQVGCHAPATKIEYRTSADGAHWSAPADAACVQPGYCPWHVDVIHVPAKNEFWMLLSAFPQGLSCHDTVLFFARSSDGIHWITYDRAALPAGTGSAWDHVQVYRATLLYDARTDLLRVWYSANDDVAWHVGYTERRYAEFLGLLQGNACHSERVCP